MMVHTRLKVERLDGARGKDRFEGRPWGWSCFVCSNDYLCEEEGWKGALNEAIAHGLDHAWREDNG